MVLCAWFYILVSGFLIFAALPLVEPCKWAFVYMRLRPRDQRLYTVYIISARDRSSSLAAGHSRGFLSCRNRGLCHRRPNKSSGVCSVCLATRQLHLRDGTVHRHGPDSPCPGSNTLPLSVTAQRDKPGFASHQPAPIDNTAAVSSVPSTQSSVPDRLWSPPDFALIKHIPKSARPVCVSHLTSLLRSIVQEPASVAKWLDLFNFGGAILKPPKRGGKRHNLSATVRKRISTFPARLTSDAPAFTVHDKRRNSPTRLWQLNLKTATSGQLSTPNLCRIPSSPV